MSKCRICKQAKWKGDDCNNPDCSTTSKVQPLKFGRKSRVITVTTKHGYHEPVNYKFDAR
jgi:hypothetical protein